MTLETDAPLERLPAALPPEASSSPSGWFLAKRPLLLVYVAVFVPMVLFFSWTAGTSGTRVEFGGNENDYFNLLTDGFLHGSLSLPLRAPQGLLALANPYLPAANAPYRAPFQDLAFYHGHFYMAWGPAPVLTLFLPWRIFGSGPLPEKWAIFIYATAGLAAGLAWLFRMIEDYVPGAKTWHFVVGAVALGTGNLAAFLVRTPDAYEVAVSAGTCFLSIGLYLISSGGLGGRYRPRRVLLGSVFFGLAAASRWELALAGLLLVALALGIYRRRRPLERSAAVRLGLVVLGPFALAVVLLLAYNDLRFGSPFNGGISYIITGYNPDNDSYYHLGYLAPNLYYYLVAPLRWTLAFPFLVLAGPPYYPGSTPPIYLTEQAAGIITTTPVVWFLLGLPLVLRRRVSREAGVVISALVLVALALALAISFTIPGDTMRYEADFASLLIVPAVLVFLRLFPRRALARALFAVIGVILVGYGALAGLAISINGDKDMFAVTAPGADRQLVSWTAPLPDLVTKILGHPVLISVSAVRGDEVNPRYSTLGAGEIAYLNLTPEPADLSVFSPSTSTWTMFLEVGPGDAFPSVGHARTFFVVTDRLGAHRYLYQPTKYLDRIEGASIPVHLVSGENHVLISVEIGRRHLSDQTAVYLSASDLSIGPPLRSSP